MIYKKNSFVGGGLIGADTNLSVLGAFRIVEDAVTEMMGQLKIDGLSIKRNYNATWVFTKNRVKILRPLAWSDCYTVESFITSFSAAKLNIDTAVKDERGAIAVYARTEMCALDLQTGKIRKTSTVGLNESIVKEQPLMQIDFCKFDGDDLLLAYSAQVRSTNLDFNLHTNNVEYLRFVMNAYSAGELIDRPVKEIEVGYLNQSFEYDELQVYRLTQGNKDTVVIRKGDTAVVRCEILR